METQANINTSAVLDTSGKTSVAETVSAAQVSRLAATLGIYNEGAPEGAVLQPGWHTVFCNAILNARDLANDGLPRLDPVLPEHPAFPFRLFGGTEITFLVPIPIGAALTCESRIRNVAPKTGRSGPILVLELERKFLLGDEVAVIENQSIIYKQDPATPPLGNSSADAALPVEKHIVIGELDVFRFSALTFNSHRIHYDAPYTRGVETKPGLLIQAKLTALHLLGFCLEKAGDIQPQMFSFRSV